MDCFFYFILGYKQVAKRIANIRLTLAELLPVTDLKKPIKKCLTEAHNHAIMQFAYGYVRLFFVYIKTQCDLNDELCSLFIANESPRSKNELRGEKK